MTPTAPTPGLDNPATIGQLNAAVQRIEEYMSGFRAEMDNVKREQKEIVDKIKEDNRVMGESHESLKGQVLTMANNMNEMTVSVLSLVNKVKTLKREGRHRRKAPAKIYPRQR